MSNNTKIIEQLSETRFIIEKTGNASKVEKIDIVHDYIRFTGAGSLPSDVQIHSNSCQVNWLTIDTSLQIPIRAFSQVMLPLLNSDHYTTPEHINRSYETGAPYYAN